MKSFMVFSFFNKGIILGFLMLVTGLGVGQDLKQILSETQDKYKKAEAFAIVMNVRVYGGEDEPSLIMDQQAFVNKSYLQYSYRFGESELLMNNDHIIMADHNERHIMYSDRNIEAEKEIAQIQTKFDIDSIFSFYENPVLVKTTNGVSHFRIVQKTGKVELVDLFIRQRDTTLVRLDYSYKEGQRVSIGFEKFDFNPIFDLFTFDTARFFSVEKSKIKPSKNFNGYQIQKVESNN